jgi:hypothetical protein
MGRFLFGKWKIESGKSKVESKMGKFDSRYFVDDYIHGLIS